MRWSRVEETAVPDERVKIILNQLAQEERRGLEAEVLLREGVILTLINELERIADAEPTQRDRIRQVLNGGAA